MRSDFFDNKEKIRRRTVCTSRILDAVSGKIAAKTPLSGYEHRFLHKEVAGMTNQELCTQYELLIALIETGNTDRALKILHDAVNRLKGINPKPRKTDSEPD